MRQKSLCGMLLLAVALVVSSASRLAWSAEKVPSDRLLPPNVYAYVSVPNCPDLKSRWTQTMLGKLREEKSLGPFWEDVDKQVEKISGEIEKNVSVKLGDLLSLPAGEVALAVVQAPGKPIGFVAIMDYGTNEATLDKLLEAAAKKSGEEGAKKSEKDIDGTKVILYTMEKKEKEEGKDDDKKSENGADGKAEKEANREVAYFQKDSYFVLASDISIVEAVLARWDGKHSQTFAEHKPYAYILEQSRTGNSSPALVWYLNPIDLVRAAIASNPQAAQQAGMFLGMLPVLGLSNFKAVGGAMDLATEEYDSVSRTLLYVEQPTTGILNMFQFPATEQTPPSWVTDDATSYFAINWNASSAYDAVEALYDTFTGPGAFAGMIDSFASNEQGPKVHLKKDLIDQISGQMHVTSDAPNADDPAKQRFLFAIDVKDNAKMKTVLESVAKVPGFPGEAREFHGHTIYEMEAPPPVGDGSSKFGICVSDGHLLITNDVTRIDQLILADKDRKPLSESAGYKKIAKIFPAKTSMLSYSRQDTQIQALYDMLRNGTIGGEIEGIDFSKLPPFEAIRKYLPATGSYVVPDKNGALFVSFSLKADK